MIDYGIIDTGNIEQAAKLSNPLGEMLDLKQQHRFDRGIFCGMAEFKPAMASPTDGETMQWGGSGETASRFDGFEESDFFGVYCRDPQGNELRVHQWGLPETRYFMKD